jgi:hypothetical protein
MAEQNYENDLSGLVNDITEDFAGPLSGNTQEASTYANGEEIHDAIGEQIYEYDLSGLIDDGPEDFAGQKSGITQEASTYANGEEIYDAIGEEIHEHLSGLVNNVPEDLAGPISGNTQGLGDWMKCSSNSQCSNRCCSDYLDTDQEARERGKADENFKMHMLF